MRIFFTGFVLEALLVLSACDATIPPPETAPPTARMETSVGLPLNATPAAPTMVPSPTLTPLASATELAAPTPASTVEPSLAPTSTRTALPPPSLAPTDTPEPTGTTAPPTPVQPITAWLTYTNSARGYRISYPNTWYLAASDPIGTVFVTSFALSPSGHGGIPPGSVKVDVGVISQSVTIDSAPGATVTSYCVDGRCGTRTELRTFSEPISIGLNRSIYVQIPVNTWRYTLFALIDDPPADAERNAALVEQIIVSWHFVQQSP